MMPPLLRDHLCVHRGFYVTAFFLLVIFGSILILNQRRQQRAAWVDSWPVAQARIIESHVEEIDLVSKYSKPQNQISARLRLVYQIGGDTYQTEVNETWKRTDARNFRSLLATGQEISIRHHPGQPETISLHFLTCRP